MSSPTPSATSTAGSTAPTNSQVAGKTNSRTATRSPAVGAKTKIAPASSPTPTANANAAPSPLTIGKTFIKQYYQVLSKTPQNIHQFYKPNTSVLSHSFLSSDVADCKTLSSTNHSDIFEWAISNEASADETIAAGGSLCLDFGNGAIDAQETIQGGILLVVTGHMKLPDTEKAKTFVHTFLLNNGAPAGKKRQFYVHNDILRFIAEPDAEEHVDTSSQSNNSTQEQPQALSNPSTSSTSSTSSNPTTDDVTEQSAVTVNDTIPDKTQELLKKPAAQAQDAIHPTSDTPTTDSPSTSDVKPPQSKGGHTKSNTHNHTSAADHPQPPVKNSTTKTENKRKSSNASAGRADSAPNTNVTKSTVDGGGGGGRKKNHERNNSNDMTNTPKEEKKV